MLTEMEIFTGDTWVCACEKVLNDASLIGNHNCPFEAISVSCVNCSKVFSSAEDFTRHKERPSKLFYNIFEYEDFRLTVRPVWRVIKIGKQNAK